MTDFAALLQLDQRQPARDLHLVAARGYDAWRATLGGRQRAQLSAARFAAKPGEVAILPGDGDDDWSVAVGGDDLADPWALASAAAKLPGGTYRIADAGAAGLGWCIAQHRFDRYRKADDEQPPRVLLSGNPVAVRDTVRMAEATALVRDLVDTPANDLDPAALAEAIVAQGRLFGATVNVIKGEGLRDGFPAVHAVGRAAAATPRLIELTWGDPAHPRLTIVGKGVTFDSGGLDIKGASGMALMKKDMGGAAHALALARLVMQADLPVRLRLIVPAVENAIAGNAFRPGDVIATRKGLTVEIGNTDAEGRLILADALTLAQEDDPDWLIDFATLTGAARVALGPELPAMFSNDEGLAAALLAGGTATRDPLWRMPLWPGYRDMLKSPLADLGNAPEGGFAGAITAALFLERFIDDGRRWAHFDTFAWTPVSKPGRPKGGEALGLRAAWAAVQGIYLCY
ncbi:leucyl aminopeptidase family protein [Glacieibacterium frigidum]|uniref:Leucyl aminopeptidase family protein n=1 Tax=Glacieibacterium frigidum TaxID=2593303 RepID=A0A552UIW7_9SPHN|nr:leucyl aminopeptidase family protein [Glacieibacterium frigidum]TRW18154.1 leucyl aminopeptidase family protein [Glacieibacterium frigidum]